MDGIRMRKNVEINGNAGIPLVSTSSGKSETKNGSAPVNIPSPTPPAMNNKMWTNRAVQRNIEAVNSMGYQLTGPAEGRLACGTQGPGRMSEPKEIFDAIEKAASNIKEK